MQDIVSMGNEAVKTKEKENADANMIIQMIHRSESIGKIMTILHVSEATVDSVMDRYVMSTMF